MKADVIVKGKRTRKGNVQVNLQAAVEPATIEGLLIRLVAETESEAALLHFVEHHFGTFNRFKGEGSEGEKYLLVPVDVRWSE